MAGAGEPAHYTGGFDLISHRPVVPHEVIGMANYNKNILVGTGGRDSINRSHYLARFMDGAHYGRAENPVRNVLNYAADHFLRHLPIVYVLTVVGRTADDGGSARFSSATMRVLSSRCALSLKVNFEILDVPSEGVVYLDAHEFHTHGWATRRSTAHAWR